jgi:hypothetical protein
MSTTPIDANSLKMQIAQFKGQALSSLFTPTPSSPLPGAAESNSFFNTLSNTLPDYGKPFAPADALLNNESFGSLLDKYSSALNIGGLPTSTTPTGLDSSQAFSTPGQNMVTVLNRVEVSFKAQYAELGHMRQTLIQEQDAARKLIDFNAQSDATELKAALNDFVASYNAGVNRFAPEVAQGGILEGSWEAERARFATERDISYLLTGSEVGVKGGLASLGITTDRKTGLASMDESMLDAALAKNKGTTITAINDFGKAFVLTVDNLNAVGHAQLRQMDNLDRAVHWIDANRAAVQKEFGPGAAATPNDAFAKAAARYDQIAKLKQPV